MPKAIQAIMPVAQWWLDLAREFVRAEEGERTLEKLGDDLARHIPGKGKGFEHAQLSNFKNSKVGATLELIVALCAEYEGLPLPLFFARTQPEASDMAKVQRKHRPAPEPVVIGLPPPRPPLAEVIALPKPKGKRRAANEQISHDAPHAKRRAR